MTSAESMACPHCGESIPGSAKACPYCGSDEETGWSEKGYLDGINLPDDDDSYEEMRKREFGGDTSRPPQKLWIYLTAIVILVLAALGLIAVLR